MIRSTIKNTRYSLLWLLLSTSAAFAQAPVVVDFNPKRFTMNNPTTVGVDVQFDQAMDQTTLQSPNFLVYGEKSGFHDGTYGYNGGTFTATLTPTTPFEAGERVVVILTQSIQNAGGTPLAASLQWSFYVRVAGGTAKFNLDSTYATGNGAHFVGVGYFNNDTDLDIAIPHSKADNVYTWLNLGNGDFSQNEILSVGDSPRALTIGDFDRDGNLDMVVSNQISNNVTPLLNDGDGTYTAQSPVAVGTEPVHVNNGDLNGDGALDLTVTNSVSQELSVLINNGNGTFQAAVNYALPRPPESSFVGDYNNDGFMDVVVTNFGGGNHIVSLFTNDGTGALNPAQEFDTGNTPRIILGQDFNADGFLDVATVDRDLPGISILLNNQAGGFQAHSDLTFGTDPFSIAVGDLDGDLDADLVVTDNDNLTNEIKVLLNDGSGTFSIDSTYSADLAPRGVNTGDFDGDGALDFGVANFDNTAKTLQIFVNAQSPNDAPQAPTLNTPSDLAHLNQSLSSIVLNWNVPVDNDGDSLHFLVEISQVSDFSSTVVSADSRVDGTGFSPTPPVAQSVTDVSYTVATALADGPYWWRVTAHDGTTFGNASISRKFTVDTISPVIDSTTFTNPSPDFLPNWYNQSIVSTVDWTVHYDEANADRALFILGSLGSPQNVTPIPSGTDQTALVQINIGGAADGSYPLAVSVFDSAGNQTVENTSIALDATAPTGAVASSPAESLQENFTVSWSSGSDGAGSGISGIYDVQVQVNGGAWTPWRTNFLGTSDTYNGQDGDTYAFEAAAHDNVGNVETFLDIAETTTVVDTTTDSTPPGQPLNLTANGSNPSPWQNIADFPISWQNPVDASGIARALYKLGTAPTSNFDTTGSVTGATSVVISANQENGQDLFLWLVDGAGNVSFQNNDSVTLRYDATAPTGTQASSPAVSVTETFTVSWAGTGSDGNGSGLSGIYDVRVQVDGGAFSDWLTNFSGTNDNYPGEHGKTYGFEVAAHDVAGNVEAFTQVAETTTEVDTTANDAQAPGPPTMLLASGSSPSPWQNDPQFEVTWQEPADPSGIAAAYYKRGNIPTANFDTTGSVVGSTTLTINATVEEGQDLFLWFADQRGNIDFRNNGTVALRYDATPPEIFEMDFLNADFLPNWYRQSTTGTAQLAFEYTEFHASSLTLASADLDTSIDVQNVESGEDVQTIFDLAISGKPDGLYQINFTLADSAGNVATDSTILALDATAPTGTLASSPDSSKEVTFTVTWSGGADGSGSGLADIYDIRVQENGGTWQDWLTDFSGTSSDFTGNSGSTYGFEAVAHDNVGNVEAFLEQAESETFLVLDTTAPTGTQASSPDTSRDLTFTVTWGGGTDGDGSGLSGVYDVRVQENGGAWQDWLTNFSGTTSDYTGVNGSTYGFEAAAHDNAGNVEAFLNIAETETVIDIGFTDVLAPTILHTPMLTVDQGQDATIEATVQDNVQVTEVLLFYKQSGDVAFQSKPMVNTGGSTYAATISSAQISLLGVNYFIRASDGVNEAFDPADDYDVLPYNISVRITGTNNSGLARGGAFTGGNSVNSYRMISVPLALADGDPIAVLEDDLGPYDSKKWRLYEYISSSDTYREYPNVSPFSPNRALWLIVRASSSDIDSGPGTSVVTNEGFEITLNQGWTDIGMPFSFPVTADNIEIVAGDPTGVIGPYTYREGWLLPNQVPTLEPWEGYTFFSPTAGVRIAIHPVSQTSSASQTQASRSTFKAGASKEWSVQIKASSGEITDSNNFLGVAASASAAWDRFDYLEPPFISDFVSVRFPHSEWETVSGNFKSDFRPPFEAGQVWSFEVATSLKSSRIKLQFESLTSLPSHFKTLLLDKTTYEIIDLQARSEYAFLPNQETLTRRFDLVIGTDSYVESSEALDVVPETFSLSQNFPNPFNAGTTLIYHIAAASEINVKVLNILGQEVRQLIQDRKEPGVYRVHWDGRADSGVELSSGVYFIRMQAGKFQQIRKVLFVR